MKTKYYLAAMAAAVLLFAGEMPEAQADDPSYPMVCRAGGAMHGVSGDERTVIGDHPLARDTRLLNIHFQRSNVGASVRQPAPGQCAWLDRGISADEPNVLVLMAPVDLRVYHFVHRQGGISVELAPGIESDFGYLARSIQNGDVFYLRARQYRGRGARHFVITHVGP